MFFFVYLGPLHFVHISIYLRLRLFRYKIDEMPKIEQTITYEYSQKELANILSSVVLAGHSDYVIDHIEWRVETEYDKEYPGEYPDSVFKRAIVHLKKKVL